MVILRTEKLQYTGCHHISEIQSYLNVTICIWSTRVVQMEHIQVLGTSWWGSFTKNSLSYCWNKWYNMAVTTSSNPQIYGPLEFSWQCQASTNTQIGSIWTLVKYSWSFGIFSWCECTFQTCLTITSKMIPLDSTSYLPACQTT
jgi:hypothetical protein